MDDPRDDQTFYVGITVDLYQRFREHVRCDGTNTQKDQRIQEIRGAGHIPIMRTIERVDTFEWALSREQYWIGYFQSVGSELTNAQVRRQTIQKRAMLLSSELSDPWERCSGIGRRSTKERTRELFELYWNEHPRSQSFSVFFADDLSDDMCLYYQKHYISKKGKSHAQYKQWRREWLVKQKETT